MASFRFRGFAAHPQSFVAVNGRGGELHFVGWSTACICRCGVSFSGAAKGSGVDPGFEGEIRVKNLSAGFDKFRAGTIQPPSLQGALRMADALCGFRCGA